MKETNEKFNLSDDGLRVLSLFDGISCGMVALERAGFKVDRYVAYEIEPNAIKISKKNYPQIEHCGDVITADFSKYEGFDLLIGGSPCTNFSAAKNHTAKNKKEKDINEGEGWELFKQYARALNEAKPKYFLYENNYRISKNISDEITSILGVQPILIDSALVSAQQRKRLYWTNIPNVTQPEDKGLVLKDIFIMDENLIRHDDRILPRAIQTKNYIKYDLTGKGYYSQQDRLYPLDVKAPTIARCRTETKTNMLIDPDDWSTYKIISPVEAERLQTLPDNYTDCVAKTRRFEAIGNGWTVDVVAHIFSFIPRCFPVKTNPIRLLIGGSPCTHWSIAQKNNRETEAEGLGWELFKNFLIAKEKFKPDFFFYENNKSAAQPIKDQIQKELGTDLMYINSALVSAQNRQRFYVFNWEVKQPQDRCILLKDILESSSDYALGIGYRGRMENGRWKKRYESNGLPKANTITTAQTDSMVCEPIRIGEIGHGGQGNRIYSIEGKSVTQTASSGCIGSNTGLYATPICHIIPQEVKVRKYTCDISKLQTLLRDSKSKSKLTNKQIADKLHKPQTEVEHWFRTDKYFNIPDENVWFDLKSLLNIQTHEYDNFVTVFETREGIFEKADRCYDVNGKMSTLMTGQTDNIIMPNYKKEAQVYRVFDGKIIYKDKSYPIKLPDGEYIIRKLTPIECERLQTLPDGYTEGVSNAQRYKALGNGWTAEVIIHCLDGVLKDIPKDYPIEVLSMYDGIGTGRYCLDKMGFTNVQYKAYEIDKYAIQIATKNYPDIIECGDAFKIREDDWGY